MSCVRASKSPRRCNSCCACANALLGGKFNQAKSLGCAPHCASSNASGAKSVCSISGSDTQGCCLSCASLYKRTQIPGSKRPARPARCSAED
ncbi:Uncharacterised protein [Vibrio cholerae]|nr:Uncharacterised protein [Vibrio cholerae]